MADTTPYRNPFLDMISNVGFSDTNNKLVKPQYSISADDIFASGITNWAKQAVCYGWVRHENRSTQGYSNASLTASGPINAFNIVVMVDANGAATTIQQKFHSGSIIKSIKISMYDNHDNPLVPLQETEYKDCKIQEYRQEGDKLTFAFSFAAVKDKFNEFDPVTGKKRGQKAATIDFEKWTVK